MKIKQLFCLLLTAVCLLGFAGTAAAADCFDTSLVNSQGVVKIAYTSSSKLKVIIQKDSAKYTYDLKNDGSTECFPLQLGNGTYTIKLMQNTSGSSYKQLSSTTVSLSLANPNSVFLQSVQNINYGSSPISVQKAAALTAATADPAAKARLLWDYMVKNCDYNYTKLSTLPDGYIPSADATITTKNGICYDFSCLYAAMLRSQGIPAKLVKGYAPKNAVGYHAWNEVYDAAKGSWLIVDTTYDLQIYDKKQSVTMNKSSADFNKVYEY